MLITRSTEQPSLRLPHWRCFTSIVVYVLVLLALLGLVACSDDDDRQAGEGAESTELQPIVYGTQNELSNLNPTKSLDIYTLQVTGQMMEGLVGLNADNEVVPLLAKSWSANDDFTQWTFEIREGINFHQHEAFGDTETRTVTADDVKYSFERLVKKDAVQSFALAGVLQGVPDFREGVSENVSGIEVLDSHTVVFHLTRADPSFINRITSPWFPVMAREAVKLGDDVYGLQVLVGTGPFQLVSRSDTEVVLERNPDYWRDGGGNVGKVTFKVIKNEQVRMTEFKNDNIDLMQLPVRQAPAVRTVQSNGNIEMKSPYADNSNVGAFKTYNSHLIGFNTELVDRPLRRSISYGIDRNEITSVVLNDSARVLSGPVPDGMPGYPSQYNEDIYDTDLARAALGRSSFDTESESLTLLVHNQAESEATGTLVQQQLAEIGIDVKLEKLDFNAALQRIVKGETAMFSMFFEYVFSAPDQVLNNMFHSDNIPVPNFWRYESEEVDRGLKELSNTKNEGDRRDLAAKLEKTIMEDAPAAFLFQMDNELIWSNRMSDVHVNGHNIPVLWRLRVGLVE